MTDILIVLDDDNCKDLEVNDLSSEIDKEYVDDAIIGLCGALLEIRATTSEQPMRLRTFHLAH